MTHGLLFSVRLLDGRYHGLGDWPPSPGRLFQALVAGAGIMGPLADKDADALRWLEQLEPPRLACPFKFGGQTLRNAVPNNDLDSVGGDVRRISGIRTWKRTEPQIFDPDVPFNYAWIFDESETARKHSEALCRLAERLYQFGRGVDMAWAWAEVLDQSGLDQQMATHPGQIFRPAPGSGGISLLCPKPGSLMSLKARYAANRRRFSCDALSKSIQLSFSQPPKARLKAVVYESPPVRQMFELKTTTPDALFYSWPQEQVVALIVQLRDGAADRLRNALPDQESNIEHFLVGRKRNGPDSSPPSSRVRILPLASIGHFHADHGIRRVLVEVPGSCGLRANDVFWALSGLILVDPKSREVLEAALTPTKDESMFYHYGIGSNPGFRIWRTVTPAALPKWIEHHVKNELRSPKKKNGPNRRSKNDALRAGAVVQALRHAGVQARATTIRLQREPYSGTGKCAQDFASSNRFHRRNLCHVEVKFNTPISGPLAIGNGRFLGLGLMAPVCQYPGVLAFEVVSQLAKDCDPLAIASALRRATMARAQAFLAPRESLGCYFTGHSSHGSPADSQRNPHLSFAFDPMTKRLLVLAPHFVESRPLKQGEAEYLALLEKAMEGLRELRAGRSGCLVLRPIYFDAEMDRLATPSRVWENITPYRVTRHSKHCSAHKALATDLRAECHRRDLPQPTDLKIIEAHGVPGVGLEGHVRLTFPVVVKGPLILGKSRFLGGGLFSAVNKGSGGKRG